MLTEVSSLPNFKIHEDIATAPNRSYRWRWPQRLGSIGFTGFVVGFLIHDFRTDQSSPLRGWATFFVAIQSLLLVFGVGWIVRAFWSKVTVTHSRIVLRTPFRKKILQTGSIRGRRKASIRSGPAVFRRMTLESNDKESPSIEFDSVYNFDDEFYRWFESLRDLEAVRSDGDDD